MAITINGTPAGQLGVTGLVISLVNQAPSMAKITCEGVASTFDGLASGSTVVIVADKLTFSGTVLRRPFDGSGESGTGFSAIVTDAWQALEDETIITDATLAAGAIGRRTRIAIGGRWIQWTTGEGDSAIASWRLVPMPLADWIDKVFAQDKGYSLDSTVGGTWPPAQGDCIKYAEALRMILRWLPGSVATISGQMVGSAPKLTLRTVASMATYEAPYHAETTRIDPRDDLVITGVGLELRKVVTGLGTREDTTFDTAGTVPGRQAFVASFDLLPEQHQLTPADFLLRKIEPDTIEFWQDILPHILGQAIFVGATLAGASLTREDPELTSIVLAGSIPKEFKDFGCDGPFGKHDKIYGSANGTTAKIGKVFGQATFTLTGGGTAVVTLQEAQATNLDPLDDADPTKPSRYVYEDHDAKNPGEDFADFAGISSQVLADGSLLRHEGASTWPVDEIPAFADLPMGKRIRFPDAPVTAWKTLDAPVYAVQIDCMERTIRAEYGHDGYLSAQDRVSLERAKNEWPRPTKERVSDDGGNPPDAPSDPIAPAAPPTLTGSHDTLPDLGPFEPRGDVATGEISVGASTVQGVVPSGMNPGNSPVYKFNGGASGYCWIEATRSDTSFSSVTIAHGASEPGAGSDPTYKRALFSWERTGTAGNYVFTFAILRKGPIEASICQSAYDDSWSVTFDGGS
jgi:hypothetical protein